MPNLNGTGPRGAGPFSGRGRGMCAESAVESGFGYAMASGNGRNCCPGLGLGLGRRFGHGANARAGRPFNRRGSMFFNADAAAQGERASFLREALLARQGFLKAELALVDTELARVSHAGAPEPDAADRT